MFIATAITNILSSVGAKQRSRYHCAPLELVRRKRGWTINISSLRDLRVDEGSCCLRRKWLRERFVVER
jgi:hypothetical protein